jgi:hypothetical protein
MDVEASRVVRQAEVGEAKARAARARRGTMAGVNLPDPSTESGPAILFLRSH